MAKRLTLGKIGTRILPFLVIIIIIILFAIASRGEKEGLKLGDGTFPDCNCISGEDCHSPQYARCARWPCKRNYACGLFGLSECTGRCGWRRNLKF